MERTPQNTCLIPPHEMQGVQRAQVGFSPLDFGEAVRGAALRAGFRQAHFNSRASDGSFTGRRRLELANLRSASDTVLLVRWMAMSTGRPTPNGPRRPSMARLRPLRIWRAGRRSSIGSAVR